VSTSARAEHLLTGKKVARPRIRAREVREALDRAIASPDFDASRRSPSAGLIPC
jgi:hypothetical protein